MTCIEPHDIYVYDLYYIHIYVNCIELYDTYMYDLH